MEIFWILIGSIGVCFFFARIFLQRETIYEYERGLLFRRGALRRTLPSGQYWILKSASAIRKVDVRLRTVTVPGQEVPSADHVAIKVSLVAQYAVADPVAAITRVECFQTALYTHLQLALREFVGGLPIDDVVAEVAARILG